MRSVDDRKKLPEHETLIRCVCATPQSQFAEFTEKQLLYRASGRRLHSEQLHET